MTSGPPIRLRDATSADADLLEAWADSPEVGGFNDFGDQPAPSPRDVLARGPLRTDRNGMMLVELHDGTVIGSVSWHAVEYGPNAESMAWNVGIELRPEFRGRGYGTEAQRKLAQHLFATTSVNRVEASTDVRNLAEQRSLEKAGFRREGIQRGAQFRAGSFHDLVIYAALRNELD